MSTLTEYREARAEMRAYALKLLRKQRAAQAEAERLTLELAQRARNEGVREVDVARALGISRPTLRRRLAALTDEVGTPPMV